MKLVTFFVLILVLLVSATPAFGQRCPPPRIENIARVLIHEPGWYTLLVNDGDGKGGQFVRFAWISFETPEKFVYDVPAGKPMWVESSGRWNAWNGGCSMKWVRIHLHSPADLNAAGWSYRSGKTTRSGQTAVLE